jgi:uncharacterized protein YtpQ (UPF0354 family)
MRSWFKRDSHPLMDTSAFTTHFLTLAQPLLAGVRAAVIKPLHVRCTTQDGNFDLFLDNGYAAYREQPMALEAVVRRQLAALHELLAPPSERTILAMIKPADYVSAVRQQLDQVGHDGKSLPLVYRPLNDDLVVVLAFDSAAGIQMLTPDDAAAAEMSELDLYRLALRNLAAHVAAQQLRVQRLDAGSTAAVYGLGLDQTYEASVLLLDDYWKAPGFAVAGEIVAFVPTRDRVLVTGSADAEGLRVAAALTQTWYAEGGYAISPHGYVYRAGRWERYSA